MAPAAEVTFTTGSASVSTGITYVLALFILAACAFLAWRRRRYSPAHREHGRWSRVAIASLFFAGGMAILLAVADPGHSIGSLAIMAMGGFLLCGFASLAMTSMIELAIWRVRASRTRKWLIAAPILFSVALPIPLVAVSLAVGGSFLDVFQWELLRIVAIAAGASLIWWSCLPARPAEVGRLFE